MSIGALFFIAVGLSMDAFTAALCKGLGKTKPNPRRGLLIALLFGGFQALMPWIGWVLGKRFESYITAYDHWVAFILLALIGGKMIIDTIRTDRCDVEQDYDCRFRELIMLAVATSIDALAVGVTFAFLQVNIMPAVLLIGITTFTLSFIGYQLGYRLGCQLGRAAELVGGVILILIGSKILVEHLDLLSF